MPSLFPGMDPFLENQEWEDFHSRMITALSDRLSPGVQPDYVVRVERRVYVERQETYLVICERDSREVITVIELLAPANKRYRSDGRREYLVKRSERLSNSSHLVELDFVRGGERQIMGKLPQGDYYAIISRSYQRFSNSVYAWTLRDKLPTIPILLKRGDADAQVALQEVFDTVWQCARYDLSLNYKTPVDPPFSAVESEWVKTLRTAG